MHWARGAPPATCPSAPTHPPHLRGGTGPEGPQDDVHHALGREHVAAHHGRFGGRVQDGASRNHHAHRRQAALRGGASSQGARGISPRLPRDQPSVGSPTPPGRFRATAHAHAHLVKRDVAAHQTAQTVDERRQRDGPRGVEVAEHLRPGAAEVEHGAALPAGVVEGSAAAWWPSLPNPPPSARRRRLT